MGDGTNFVLSFCGELLHNAEELINNGLHISDILTGYEKGFEICMEKFDEMKGYKVQDVTNYEEVSNVVKSTIRTKCNKGQEEMIAKLVTQACISILPKAKEDFNKENIRVSKILGGSLMDSQVVKGLVITRLVEGQILSAKANNLFRTVEWQYSTVQLRPKILRLKIQCC